MEDGSQHATRVTVTARPGAGPQQAALASLCAAVERTVAAYRPDGFTVREVVVMLEEGRPERAGGDPAPVFVDVYDSGYGHGI